MAENTMTPNSNLNWTFSFTGKEHSASFIDGVLKTSLPLLSTLLRATIDSEQTVRLGFVGPIVSASLDEPEVAKATITYVIGLIADPDSMIAPVPDSFAEPDFSQALPNK